MKKNLSLIIGLCLPVILILTIIITLIFEETFIPSDYNIIFEYGTSRVSVSETYTVVDNKLRKIEVFIPENTRFSDSSDIYLYNVIENSFKAINLDATQTFYIIPDKVSPDGYEVVMQTQNQGIFPFTHSVTDMSYVYLKGQNSDRKLILPDDRVNNRKFFKFIGWINNSK